MLLTAKCVILVFCDFQGKAFALCEVGNETIFR